MSPGAGSAAAVLRNVAPLTTAATLDAAADALLEHGYVRLLMPTVAKHIRPIITGFKRLTEDPNRAKLVVSALRERHQDGANDLGLREVRRGGTKHNPRPDEIAEGRTQYDETKYVFHYNGRALGYWADMGCIIHEHAPFFLELGMLQGRCTLLAYEMAERLDRKMPGYQFVNRLREAEQAGRVRLLRYLCDGHLPGIAQRHRDQDFITVHVHSDRPQLWLADRNNERILENAEETREDSVLIFFGRKAWEITRGKLQGIVHGVLDPTFGEKNRSPRHTIVSFMHATVTPSEEAWAQAHIRDLKIPDSVSNFGS